MEHILLIDTSSPDIRVELFSDGVSKHVHEWRADRILAETIMKEIDVFLLSSNTLLSNLHGIAVVVGPGGFTTLRIGVATANALAYACHLPIWVVEGGESISEALQKPSSSMVIPQYEGSPYTY